MFNAQHARLVFRGQSTPVKCFKAVDFMGVRPGRSVVTQATAVLDVEFFDAPAKIRSGDIVELLFTQERTFWQFPPDRFVQYESSDEAWARPLGFGQEVTEQQQCRAEGMVELATRERCALYIGHVGKTLVSRSAS